MKSLLVLISLFTLTVTAASPEFKSRYDAALKLIEKRNKGLICGDATQDIITELVARSIVDDRAGLPQFIKRVPENSDILKNLEFRALLADTNLLDLADAEKFSNLLVDTRYFSRGGGVRHAVIIDLLAGGKALVNGKIKATWKSSIEIEPGADYYPFVDLTIKGERWLYLLKRTDDGLLILESATKPDPIYGVFLLEPNECGD